MKLVVLVIASDGLPVYAEHQAYWRSYATSHTDITVYFLRQREDVVTPYFDGDTIWTRGRECIERVFDKTIDAFKLLPAAYDFVIRTNLSSVWNFTKLIGFCKTLPRANVFCGVLGNPGISGAGMILSPDVVDTLVKYSNDIDRCEWDDVDFGKIAKLRSIPSMPGTRCDPRSRNDVELCWDLGYHYYLKDMRGGTRNIENELDVMAYLIEKLYPRAQVQ
jgi:hypothetical protein